MPCVLLPMAPPRFLALLGLLFLSLAVASPLSAQEGEKRSFNLPKDSADKTLKLFAEQSGRGMLVNPEILRGLETNAVSGDLPPAEALDRMLADTGLAATQDPKNGAFVVFRRKAESGRESRPAARVGGTDGAAEAEPAAAVAHDRLDDDRIVNLEAFRVTTTLGKYREVSSSSGTKTPMEIRDIPGSVQILNASFIADIRATSLEDLYPFVVGLNREGTTVAGFTLRGFSNSNPDITLNNVEVDGLPGLASRWGSPTTANVERVDIPKGPSSVMYGLLNPGGLVNIVTKHPQRVAATSLFASIADFSGDGIHSSKPSYLASLDSTGPLGADGHLFYRFIASFENLGSFRGDGYFRNRYYFPSVTYRFSADTELTLKVDVTRQRRNSDSGLVAPYYNPSLVASRTTLYQDQAPGHYEYDDGEVYTLNFVHHFGDSWTANVNARSVQHIDGRQLFENNGVISPLVAGVPDVAHAAVVRRYRDLFNHRKYNLIDANLVGTVGSAAFRQTLLFGAAFNNEVQDFRGLTNGPNSTAANSINVYAPDLTPPPLPVAGTGPANAVQRFYNYGVYASDQLKIGNHWRASAGVRYDRQDANYNESVLHRHQSQSVHSVVPSVGLVYQPTDGLSIYGSYCDSFRPSQPIFVDATGQSGFPSEKAHQLEVGVKAEFPNQKLTATLAAYQIKKQDVTEAVAGVLLPNGLQTYRISGEQESKGLEAELVFLPAPNWQVQVGYSYIDARVTASVNPAIVNARLFNVPYNDASLWTRYNFTSTPLRGLGLGLGQIYVGPRVGGYPTVTAAGTYKLGTMPMREYWRTNVAVYYQRDRFNLALNVGNLFDKQYIASIRNVFTVIPGESRKVTLSLRMPF